MTTPAIDPGHLVPDVEWPRIVRDARNARRRLARGTRHAGLGPSSYPSVTGFVQCKYDGGPQPSGIKFGVLHDAETPLDTGYAASIASYFTRNTNQTSAHFMVDPTTTIQMLDTSRVAWHCGNGNTRSIGVEQAGYVSLTTAQWTTDLGLQQIQRIAALMRDIRTAHGVGLYWMTDQQLIDAHAGNIVGGWATHAQCSRVLGGSTHTDPMPNYPLNQLMAAASTPPPAPAPAPTEDFLMALTDAQQIDLYNSVQTIAAQIGGPNWKSGSWGWPTLRYSSNQESLSVVDLLREIDRQVNSGLDLTGRPAGNSDNDFGHLLSLRAEVHALAAKLDAVAAKVGA